MHHNETYFPDAGKFDPTLWLDPKEPRRLEKDLYLSLKEVGPALE
jgi:hypothetical protein